MATQPSEVITGELKNLPISEKKSENGVDGETQKLIPDLEGRDDTPVDPVIEKITEGFLNFKINQFDKCPEFFQQLAISQHPKIMVFACCDSRVSPSQVLGFGLGEVFMFRNIANMVPGFNQLKYSGVGAGIEYALTVLGVENILVMGHSKCGGIDRLLSLPADSTNYFLDDWVQMALPAKAKIEAEFPNLSNEEKRRKCEREAVNLSLINIQTYPFVRKALADKKLALWGGYFDFLNGKFELWRFISEITPPKIIGE